MDRPPLPLRLPPIPRNIPLRPKPSRALRRHPSIRREARGRIGADAPRDRRGEGGRRGHHRRGGGVAGGERGGSGDRGGGFHRRGDVGAPAIVVVVLVVCAFQRNVAVANRRRANRPRDGMPGIRRHDLRSRLPPPSLLSLRRAPPHRQEDSTPARSRRHASLSPLFERTGRDPPTLRGGEFAKGHVDEGDQIERSAGEEVRQRGEGGLRGRWDVCHLRGGDRAGRGIVVVVVVESHEGHGEADFEGEARVEDGV
mmetsp:Transcript_3738/g.6868  ORF Transcript_3738/g.6868 Transcript_3738/m.6868 type:complete len:255 (+) Transcript_3738:405-1169(+)